jgi:hypothetical protein
MTGQRLNELGAIHGLHQVVRRSVPWGHWKTTTFVAALRVEGITAPTEHTDGTFRGRRTSGPGLSEPAQGINAPLLKELRELREF